MNTYNPFRTSITIESGGRMLLRHAENLQIAEGIDLCQPACNVLADMYRYFMLTQCPPFHLRQLVYNNNLRHCYVAAIYHDVTQFL